MLKVQKVVAVNKNNFLIIYDLLVITDSDLHNSITMAGINCYSHYLLSTDYFLPKISKHLQEKKNLMAIFQHVSVVCLTSLLHGHSECNCLTFTHYLKNHKIYKIISFITGSPRRQTKSLFQEVETPFPVSPCYLTGTFLRQPGWHASSI